MKTIKFLTGLYISAALVVMCRVSAAAYIDISSVSFLASAIAGIVIAVGAVVYTWWRKVKSKVSDTLGIDENAGKEVEEDIVITDETISDSETTETAETTTTDDASSQN